MTLATVIGSTIAVILLFIAGTCVCFCCRKKIRDVSRNDDRHFEIQLAERRRQSEENRVRRAAEAFRIRNKYGIPAGGIPYERMDESSV